MLRLILPGLETPISVSVSKEKKTIVGSGSATVKEWKLRLGVTGHILVAETVIKPFDRYIAEKSGVDLILRKV